VLLLLASLSSLFPSPIPSLLALGTLSFLSTCLDSSLLLSPAGPPPFITQVQGHGDIWLADTPHHRTTPFRAFVCISTYLSSIMAENFSTGALKEALPEGPVNGAVDDGKWEKPQAVDYTALSSENYAEPWGSHARTYQWKDEYGDVGPKYPELELELFGEPSTRLERTGLDFSR
jgi:hypothetical protein